MILDLLENLEKYISLNPLFEEVLSFIQSTNLDELENGKHLIKGEELFVNVQEAKGKTIDEAVLETHQKMIDIQIPLSGDESFGYLPCSELPEMEYNESKDMTLYPGVPSQSMITCKKGMFVIFFPFEGHAPCISSQNEFKKLIFKVKS